MMGKHSTSAADDAWTDLLDDIRRSGETRNCLPVPVTYYVDLSKRATRHARPTLMQLWIDAFRLWWACVAALIIHAYDVQARLETCPHHFALATTRHHYTDVVTDDLRERERLFRRTRPRCVTPKSQVSITV